MILLTNKGSHCKSEIFIYTFYLNEKHYLLGKHHWQKEVSGISFFLEVDHLHASSETLVQIDKYLLLPKLRESHLELVEGYYGWENLNYYPGWRKKRGACITNPR